MIAMVKKDRDKPNWKLEIASRRSSSLSVVRMIKPSETFLASSHLLNK